MNWNLRVGRRQGTRAKFLRHSPNDRDVRIAGRNIGFAAARGGAQRRTRWTGGLCRRAHAALHLEHRGPDAVEPSATKLRAPGTPKIASIRSVCTWALIQRACAYEKTSSDSGERVLEKPKLWTAVSSNSARKNERSSWIFATSRKLSARSSSNLRSSDSSDTGLSSVLKR